MQLTSMRVENYKIIEDSGEVHLDPVTCLVGKNESGKSTLLQALYKFNPVESDIIYHDLQDYPRRLLADYEDIKHEHVANVMTTRWTLQDKELKELKELLGPDGFSEQTVVVKKGYDNQRKWDFAVNEKAVAAYYLSRSGIEAAEKKELEDSESVEKLLERLKALEKPGKKQQALQERLEKAFPTTVRNAAERILESHLPVFLYFSNYQRMPGQVAMNELLEKQKTKGLAFSDKIFLALLSLAGVTAEGIQELGFFEQMIAKLEAVSNRLSKEIFSFWSQNQHLEVEFRYDAARPNDFYPYNEGYIFRTRIRNRRYGVTVNFEERSNGFVWFFSFLVWFSQVRKNYGENLIILLDEPGLNLHAKAQKDLVGYINDRLKPDHQVIYTTHSPFMIDSANLSNVRIVEDADTGKEGSLGSKVGTKSISHDPDTLYPLQAALAYDMMNGLFTDKRALLVDGPTELLYLKWFSNELKQLGRTHLDERWTIVPAGGLEKIAGFMNLLGADRERLAVFTGVNQDSKRSGDSMLEYELLQGGRVLTPLMYLEGQAEADIEDMIGRQLYAALVNHCYDLNKRQIWNPQKAKEEPTRIVPEAESHFAAFTGSKHVFDRYTVAAYLLNHSFELIDVLTDIEQSMDRFENLFVDMNRLL